MTTRERLNQHIASIQALRHAIARLQDAGPESASDGAKARHESRIERLKSVMAEIDVIAQAIADQPRSPLRLP